jgi:hypothetical protein
VTAKGEGPGNEDAQAAGSRSGGNPEGAAAGRELENLTDGDAGPCDLADLQLAACLVEEGRHRLGGDVAGDDLDDRLLQHQVGADEPLGRDGVDEHEGRTLVHGLGDGDLPCGDLDRSRAGPDRDRDRLAGDGEREGPRHAGAQCRVADLEEAGGNGVGVRRGAQREQKQECGDQGDERQGGARPRPALGTAVRTARA